MLTGPCLCECPPDQDGGSLGAPESSAGRPDVVVVSFGYWHGLAPVADLVVDVREHLRDPHSDPGFRHLTGHDAAVWARVLATPGARELITGIAATAAAVLPAARATGRVVRVAIGCAGGRHRSVVIADVVAQRLTLAGWHATVEHQHIHHPVVTRPNEAERDRS